MKAASRKKVPKKTTTKSSAVGTAEIGEFETLPLVWIKWADACHSSGSGWTSSDNYKPELLSCEAAGFLVFDGKNEWNEDCLVLASALSYQVNGKPDVSEGFTIPKAMVLDIRVIERDKK
jgi:hypothetical protein